ncbi:CAP domain-containing protein [Alkalihalobacillus sp. AL-G]|uniref:CAP domain-containing protein n=1 Tax=Alkalihalobacillus sp. AL-G TaxID=2926399 RepID=UPI00272AB3D6|nr:CAP domain-containing protein [Alkalihalobacillus sp. AL-G]WLD95035.1 CAP-associated domain-containing protein [Alkalihalobacillus sp. AL-G]
MRSFGMVVMFVFLILGVSLIYGDLIKLPQYNPPEKEQKENETVERNLAVIPKTSEGILRYFEMSSEELIAQIGEPSRIDPSPYQYDWWIYGENSNQYIQFGIDHGKVVTVFALGRGLNVAPFQIGQSKDMVLKHISFEKSLTLKIKGNEYRFELTDEELKTRPLVKLDNLWIQLYMDKFKDNLVGVRYMTPETLLIQRPYSLEYRGELAEQPELTSDEWKPVEKAEELQIFSITNVIREQYGVGPLQWHEETAEVAYQHSKEMKAENYFSHTSPVAGDLSDRLESQEINYVQAGENIAANYIDGIAAVIGWLNSEGHRKTMLSDEYTHLGVGVHQKYYTQNFIVPW